MVTVITKTIGSGKDYASFTLAEADVENIGTSADLVANDEAIVFEADAGTYTESVTFQSSLTTDATRNVTYKPAAGSGHGGVFGAGVVLHDNGAGYGGAQTIRNGYIVLDGLEVHVSNASGFRTGVSLDPTNDMFGVKLRNMLLWSQTSRAPLGVSTAAVYDMGSLADPIVYENCVFRKTDNFADLAGVAAGAGKNGHFVVANCTFVGDSAATHRALACTALGTLNVQITNCMSFVPWQWYESVSGTLNLTGSNNFGGSTYPFPVAIQGSPYPITASTAYDPGAGDFALYVGKNGALLDSPNNDVIDGGVGPSVNSDVPTRDILGNVRSGATANPGAFEVPQATTVLTRTIGPVGRDYASFILAEADVENIGASADLVFENERIVYEADAGTYDGLVFGWGLTTDPTRNVTFRPAAGSEHGGVRGAGVVIQDNIALTSYNLLMGTSTANAPHNTVFEGIESHVRPGVNSRCTATRYARGGVFRNMLFNCEGIQTANLLGTQDFGTATEPTVYENCVTYSTTQDNFTVFQPPTGSYLRVINCTHVSSSGNVLRVYGSGLLDVVLLNNLSLSSVAYQDTSTGTTTISGSNNFGASSNPFPVAIQGSPATITASQSADPGAGDYALYVGKNGALLDSPNNDVIGQGVGPDVNSSVPRTDILGNTRYGANANPGAFEIPQATYTWKKTIGPVGRDYATFTLAEADVENIPTSTDMVNENEAIVFEADAGTYNEAVNFSSTLTTDATRQVTYKPAAGSEHGGSASSGVRIEPSSGTAGTLRDYFLVFDGLVFRSSATIAVLIGGPEQGIALRNCVVTGSNGLLANYAGTGTLAAPITIESCVFSTAVWCVKTQTAVGSTPAQYFAVRNCTLSRTVTSGGAIELSNTVGTTNVELTNNLVLTGEALTQTGTVSLTGSNNFGPATNPFPAAIQGSPYPITPTTDLDPGPGDWAIYDADTGALIDDPDNDVLGGGVGPDVNLDVPTTDIRGIPRTGSTTDPGAFVLPPVEQDTWTPVMVRRNDPVDVYGVLTFGDAYINAVEDTLSVTGADGTDATPAIPVGTRALWIQLVSQTGATAGETCDVSIEVSASQSLTLATLNGAGTAVGNVPGLMQFPVDCLGQNDPNTPVYPRVKMVTGSTVGASDVVTIRVVAICGQQTNTTWS